MKQKFPFARNFSPQPRHWLGLLACLWLAACGGTPQDHLGAARAALADASWSDALEEAESGLSASPEDPVAWGLELVKLEALARSGDGDAALAQLTHLGERYAEWVPPSQYSATASQLRLAGNRPAAIQILDLGLKLHPEDWAIAQLIDQAKEGSTDSEELELLCTLGYVSCD